MQTWLCSAELVQGFTRNFQTYLTKVGLKKKKLQKPKSPSALFEEYK